MCLSRHVRSTVASVVLQYFVGVRRLVGGVLAVQNENGGGLAAWFRAAGIGCVRKEARPSGQRSSGAALRANCGLRRRPAAVRRGMGEFRTAARLAQPVSVSEPACGVPGRQARPRACPISARVRGKRGRRSNAHLPRPLPGALFDRAGSGRVSTQNPRVKWGPAGCRDTRPGCAGPLPDPAMEEGHRPSRQATAIFRSDQRRRRRSLCARRSCLCLAVPGTPVGVLAPACLPCHPGSLPRRSGHTGRE